MYEKGKKELRKMYKEDVEHLLELNRLKDEAYLMISNASFEDYIEELEEQLELIDDNIDYTIIEMNLIKEYLMEYEDERE